MSPDDYLSRSDSFTFFGNGINEHDIDWSNRLGGVHKLRLQEKGVGGQKNQLFVNFYTIESVNGGW